MEQQFNPSEYIPTIDAILKVSTLTQMTVKKIRKAIEALFSMDFNSHKKEINDIILDRFYKLNDKAQEEQDLEQQLIELRKENQELSLKLNQNLNFNDLKPQTETVKRRKIEKSIRNSKKKNHLVRQSKNKDKPKRITIINRKCGISPVLAEFLNSPAPIARTEVVKILWKYIKEKNLQNPDDKREILCDDKLRPLFGDRINMFQMVKVMSTHIFKLSDEELESLEAQYGVQDNKNVEAVSDGENEDEGDENENEIEEEDE